MSYTKSSENSDAIPIWPTMLSCHICIIVIVGVFIYCKTMNSSFFIDDIYCIDQNPAIRSFSILLDDNKIDELSITDDIKLSMEMRPVAYWTFALNYYFGGLNVFGYHLVNNAIHIINAIFVYLLTFATMKSKKLDYNLNSSTHHHSYIPLFVALLFVAHPLQTQSVTQITQRFTTLFSFFYLGTLLLYISARTTNRRPLRYILICLALLTNILAMKTHSSAFTLPVILLLYDLLFVDGPLPEKFLWTAPFISTMAIVPATLFELADSSSSTTVKTTFEKAVNLVNYDAINQWDYLITQFGVIVTYLRMFVLPVNQNVLPNHPIATSFFEPQIIASFVLLLTLFVGALYIVTRALKISRFSAGLLISFGILWYFITISISSSIIPLQVMLLEYRVYLPSYGVFLAVVMLASSAVDKGIVSSRAFIYGTTLIICVFSVAAIARNNLYNDRVALMRDTLAKNPEAWPARVTLIASLLDENRMEEAILELNTFLRAFPYDTNMLGNLAYALSTQGRYNEAFQPLQRALAINPESAFIHGLLGDTYLKMGYLQQAESVLQKALMIDPHLSSARESLAIVFVQQGRIPEAREHYRLLLKDYPGNKFLEEKLRILRDMESH